MTTLVQIPPSNVPFLDSRGFVTFGWRAFLEALVTRAGGISGALQPEDPTLTALAALDGTAGVLRQTGPDTFAKTAGVTGTKTPPASITVTNGIVTALA